MPIEITILERLKMNDAELTSLDLSRHHLETKDIQALVSALSTNTHLLHLDLTDNGLKDEAAKLLASTTSLETLIVTDNQIGSDGISHFQYNKSLTSLIVIGNFIDKLGAEALAKNRSLSSLNISHNRIRAEGAKALSAHQGLTALDVSYNEINDEGASALADNKKLRKLNVAGNGLTVHSMKLIAKNNATLTMLDAHDNQLEDDSVIELAQHPEIQELNLNHNHSTFIGAKALSTMKALHTLHISHNLLGDSGAEAIAQNKNLKHLTIAGNKINFKGAYAFSLNTRLLSIDLSHNNITDTGAIILARNHTLTTLLLNANHIGDAGAFILAENKILEKVTLSYNHIEEMGVTALRDNRTLASLRISQQQPVESLASEYETIFLLAESCLYIADMKGHIHYFNPAMIKLLGYSDDELFDKPFMDILHPEDKHAFKEVLNKAKECSLPTSAPSSIILVNRLIAQDGSLRMIRWNINIKNARLYSIGTDVTYQAKHEVELKKNVEENDLDRSNETKKYEKRQIDFMGRLSHEIRNPLNATYGAIEICDDCFKEIDEALDAFNDSPLSTAKAKMKQQVARGKITLQELAVCANYQKAILDDNVDLAKITEKALTLSEVPFDLTKTIDEVIFMFRARASSKGLTLKNQYPNDALCVVGDPSRLKQILTNLLNNAVKYTEKGEIRVVLHHEYKHTKTHVNIEVIDTGIGLNPAQLANLFGKFSQPQPSSTHPYCEGSGLGLYISKQLAQLMCGDIEVKSEKDKGSTFAITVVFDRLAKDMEKDFDQKQEGSRTTKPGTKIPYPLFFAPGHTKLKVLVVDDSLLNQKVLEKHLNEMGCQCIFASDGMAALACYHKEPFAIIFMDIIMPGMDGIAATKEIRKLETEKQVKRTLIIGVSANAFDSDREEALASGMDDYLTKPITREGLYEKMRLVLQSISNTPLTLLAATSTKAAT